MVVGDKKTARSTKSRAVKPPVIEGKAAGDAGTAGQKPRASWSGWLVLILFVVNLAVASGFVLLQFGFWSFGGDKQSVATQQILADQQALALRIDGLSEALSDLDKRPAPDLSGFAKLGPVNDLVADLVALEGDVADQRALIAQIETAEPSVQNLAPMQDQIAELAGAVAELRASDAGEADLGQRLDEMAALVAALEDGRGEIAADQSGQGAEIVALRGQLEALLAENEALRGQVGAFTRRIDDVVRARANAVQNSGDMVARLSLALALIDTALDRGDRFAVPYGVIERSGLAGDTSDDIAAVAASGAVAPSRQIVLFQELAPLLVVADDMGQSSRTRLLSKLKSSIGMRPVGMVQGDDAGAIVARVETHLARNDFASAYREWQSLPEDARSKSADWALGLKAYIDARAMVATVRRAAILNLGGTQ